MASSKSRIVWAAAGAYLGLRAVSALHARRHFLGQRVVIAGGSRGLGLILARRLVDLGASVVLLARDGRELARATEELRSRSVRAPERASVQVIGLACDLSVHELAQAALEEAAERLGGVDCLINCAGIIQVAPLQSFALADFEEAMGTDFYGTLHATLSALPFLRRSRSPRIVNIISIGGAVAVPHLAPYTAAKFAARGLSEGLCAELAREGIAITTVLPGIMRTGSYVNALFKGQREKEVGWFGLGSTLPGASISATRAASAILRAAAWGRPFVTLGGAARALRALHDLAPGATAVGLGLLNRLLPAPADTGKAEPGWLHRPRVLRSWIAAIGNRAIGKNRELPWVN